MKIQHEVPQLQEVQAQVEEVRAHISHHQGAYLFGAGVLVGALGMRLVGRPQVVVHLTQGAIHA